MIGPAMIQAIGYVRRSTDRQDESLEQQRAKLLAFAQEKGWTLADVYEDDAISGSELHRPGLERLMERAQRDAGVGAVVMWDRNRLSRPKDPVDGLMLERQLMATGKRIVYVATGTEPDRSFTSGLISYIENHQNGDYLRKLSRDVARGILAQVHRGRWPGGPIPFGYDRLIIDQQGQPRKIVRNLEDGSLLVLDAKSVAELERIAKGLRFRKQPHEEVTLTPSDPARVRALQRVFADYANGVPTRRIRDELNGSGFRSSFGGLFGVPAINCILENAGYTGKSIYNRRTESKWHRLLNGASVERHDEGLERRPAADWVVVENAWPALVDAETFARVQARRNDSRERHRFVTGSSVHAEYLLTGLGVCGVCGAKLTGQTCTNGKGVKTCYYTCSGHHRAGGIGGCPTRYTVPAEPVERHILDLIRADLQQLMDDNGLHEYVAQEFQRIHGTQRDSLDNLQGRLADLDGQTAKLRGHLLAMDAKAAQALGLYDQAGKLAAERETLQRQLGECKASQVEIPGEQAIRCGAGAALEFMDRVLTAGTLEEKRELVALYVRKVEAFPDRQAVRISLYPVLFTSKIGVTGDIPAQAIRQVEFRYRRASA